MCSSGSSDGVPPPKNTVVALRPRMAGDHSAASRATASAYGAISESWPAYELKSQYVHLAVQKGIWT